MNDFVEFGDPARFAISLRWVADSEPRSRRPAEHGWSMGDLRITIGGVNVTALARSAQEKPQDHAGWYLAPLFKWFASNWVYLFHEEDFCWGERTGLPAAAACRKALRKWIDASDPAGRQIFAAAQAWYRRHGMRAAAEGGLFPDLFIRRLVDDAELSWTSTPPLFAPDGFVFTAPSAHAMLPVEDVAAPLWQALRWFAGSPPKNLDTADKDSWNDIVRQIDSIDALRIRDLQAPYLSRRADDWLSAQANSMSSDLWTSKRALHVPVLTEFAPAVAMFGGVSPKLSTGDAAALLGLLASTSGMDSTELARLVASRGISPLGTPYRDGYDFAELLLDELGLPGDNQRIEMDVILAGLGIIVEQRSFDSKDIRGVALAGKNVSPHIVVNMTSTFNSSIEGQRFTLAHELCHVLHDRSRARRVTHVSGPWVAQGFERRANAFAAYLLMPRPLLLRHIGEQPAGQPATVRDVAEKLGVSESALVEHMFNLDLINDWEREALRPLFRALH